MIASTRPRLAAVARDALDAAFSFGYELAEHLLYSAVRRRLGLPTYEQRLRELENEVADLERRMLARSVIRFPRKDAA